jgi:hypothetical protein
MLSYTFLGQTIFIKFSRFIYIKIIMKKFKQYYLYYIKTGLEGDASFSKKRFEDSINN